MRRDDDGRPIHDIREEIASDISFCNMRIEGPSTGLDASTSVNSAGTQVDEQEPEGETRSRQS
jgi:hypothetical protein